MYLFNNCSIDDFRAYLNGSKVESFAFNGLEADTAEIFKTLCIHAHYSYFPVFPVKSRLYVHFTSP